MGEEIKDDSNGSLYKIKSLVSVFTWIGPGCLAIIIGYGSVKFSSGSTEQKILNLENKIIELQKQIERSDSRSLSREEMKIYMDGQSEMLKQIQADVRAWRR